MENARGAIRSLGIHCEFRSLRSVRLSRLMRPLQSQQVISSPWSPHLTNAIGASEFQTFERLSPFASRMSRAESRFVFQSPQPTINWFASGENRTQLRHDIGKRRNEIFDMLSDASNLRSPASVHNAIRSPPGDQSTDRIAGPRPVLNSTAQSGLRRTISRPSVVPIASRWESGENTTVDTKEVGSSIHLRSIDEIDHIIPLFPVLSETLRAKRAVISREANREVLVFETNCTESY